ncbi:MAG: integration host factor subunit beta [Arsenophonus sp. ET-YP4-MAG3]
MTRSELIEKLINQLTYIPTKFIEKAVKEILDHMIITLSNGDRIEIRGFGSFSLHYRASSIGRNPKTGNKVYLKGKKVPHFKPGKKLRDRVNIYS